MWATPSAVLSTSPDNSHSTDSVAKVKPTPNSFGHRFLAETRVVPLVEPHTFGMFSSMDMASTSDLRLMAPATELAAISH